MKPTFRCATRKVIDLLAVELNLPTDPNMQDWAYEVSNPNDIDKYICHYNLTIDDDKKFVLVEMILQAIVDQPDEQQLLIYFEKVKPILTDDFKIHEFTIHYWKVLTHENFENCKTLSLLLTQLWKTKTSEDEII